MISVTWSFQCILIGHLFDPLNSGLAARKWSSCLWQPRAWRCFSSPFPRHGGCSASCSSSSEPPRFPSISQPLFLVQNWRNSTSSVCCSSPGCQSCFSGVAYRNRGVEQDHEGDLRHAGCLPLLLHRLHVATVDRLQHQGVEDAAGRPVHDLGGQHPSVVVGLFAGKAPTNRCNLRMIVDP